MLSNLLQNASVASDAPAVNGRTQQSTKRAATKSDAQPPAKSSKGSAGHGHKQATQEPGATESGAQPPAKALKGPAGHGHKQAKEESGAASLVKEQPEPVPEGVAENAQEADKSAQEADEGAVRAAKVETARLEAAVAVVDESDKARQVQNVVSHLLSWCVFCNSRSIHRSCIQTHFSSAEQVLLFSE